MEFYAYIIHILCILVLLCLEVIIYIMLLMVYEPLAAKRKKLCVKLCGCNLNSTVVNLTCGIKTNWTSSKSQPL